MRLISKYERRMVRSEDGRAAPKYGFDPGIGLELLGDEVPDSAAAPAGRMLEIMVQG